MFQLVSANFVISFSSCHISSALLVSKILSIHNFRKISKAYTEKNKWYRNGALTHLMVRKQCPLGHYFGALLQKGSDSAYMTKMS